MLAPNYRNEASSPIFVFMSVAITIFIAFVGVLCSSALHVHERCIGDVARVATEKHTADAPCSFCDVVKERVAVLTTRYNGVVGRLVTVVPPATAVACAVDRAAEQIGRAPPAL